MNATPELLVERALAALAAVRPHETVVTAAILPAHASPRRYVRVHVEGSGEPLLVMVLPPADREPEEKGATLSDRVAQEPFVALAGWLSEVAGLPVPTIHGVDEVSRTVVLEDFGTRELLQVWEAASEAERPALHEDAVDLLLAWQGRTLEHERPRLIAERSMDAQLLRWELEHYVEWRLGAQLGVELPPADQDVLNAAFSRWIDAIVDMPTVVIHRDWQSRNLMCLDGGGLGILDFQDAMMGPYVYDIVALLRDSYVDLPVDQRRAHLERFARGSVGAGRGRSPDDVVHDACVMTLQRKLKDAGRFVYIDRVRGNPGFLKFIALSLAHVADALRALPEEAEVAGVLAEHDPAFAAAWAAP